MKVNSSIGFSEGGEGLMKLFSERGGGGACGYYLLLLP